MDYNKTINLPKTDFPMRRACPSGSPRCFATGRSWTSMGAAEEERRQAPVLPPRRPPLLQRQPPHGPRPEQVHQGHHHPLHAMRGYYTPYIPGWDNHGMPIESAIIKQNKLNRKKMPVTEFRSACHEFAQHYVEVQSEGFQRLGAIGDWEHPYLTMNPSFEAEEVKVFGEMYKRGYIYKGLKPVYWCPHDETALAEAEIEYQDDPCTTVYVKFPLHDDLGKLDGYDKSKVSFVIWTTTIWTLPGNLAIALHPEESYALVRNPNGEIYILAEALVKKVMEVGGVEGYTVLATHPGSFFENMLADHPFLPKTSRLVLADYVTMDSGTGCVHTAPGFGADDYQTCKRYGMDMVVPVDDQGRHTDYAGKYAGLKTEESNPIILADMKASGALFAAEDIVHSYPHCWRCKNPIIFRATPQWFCSVETFKDEACAACDQVRWVPAWGLDRMKAMVRERADWCISRQRRWGLPIPVFYCNDCGKPIATDETIGIISDLFAAEGSNAWFAKDAAEILPPASPAPTAVPKRGFTKEDRHPGRLVRLRFLPLRRHEEGPGLLARHHVSGGPGPVPRLVPVGAADRRGRLRPGRALQGVRHPRLDRGRRGQSHAQVPGQWHGPGRDHQPVWRGPAAPVGRQRRLPRRRPLLSRDLQAAQPELPQVPQHRPVLPGQSGRL